MNTRRDRKMSTHHLWSAGRQFTLAFRTNCLIVESEFSLPRFEDQVF